MPGDRVALEGRAERNLAAAALLAACALACVAVPDGHALAQPAGATDAQMANIARQIQALKAEVQRLKRDAAEHDRQLRAARQAQAAQAATPPAAQPAPVLPQIPAGYALVPAAPGSTSGSVVLARVEPPPAPLGQGNFQVGNATIHLGGFLADELVFRSRNEVNDIQSSFNGIPERNSQLYHETEFHETARQSRITGLITEDPDEVTRLQAYVSVDFEGGAPTSNYNESNSWIPRLREAYAEYKRSDWGFEFLGGQAWSLLTSTRVGLEPLNINPPPTIDPNYTPGFIYARQGELRVAKSFDHEHYWLAASVENSATIYGSTSIPSALGTLNVSNPGVGIDGTGSNATTSVGSATVTTVKGKQVVTTTSTTVVTPGLITNDIAPDVIVKAVADYAFGHFEAFGLGRVFHDRLSQTGTGQSNTLFGGGGGGGALIHLIPHVLDFQVSGLAGQGISRYDPTQLPDATIGAHGQPVALPAYSAVAGLIGHPTPPVDLYAFLGTDQITGPRYFNAVNGGKLTAYGYGNPLYDNEGCFTELAPASTCTANTSGVVQGSFGGWYRFLHGAYGTMQVGAEYTYTRRFVFQGVGRTPQTDENQVLFSFRYFPFQ